MPEIGQFMFGNKELLELLIKKAGVHDGRWMISITFGFSAANFGPTAEQLAPGAVVVVNQIGIQRAQSDTPPAMTADAAIVNPPAASKR